MSHFNEENTVENMVLDTLSRTSSEPSPQPSPSGRGSRSKRVAEERAGYGSMTRGWRFVFADELPRQHSDVFVEQYVRDSFTPDPSPRGRGEMGRKRFDIMLLVNGIPLVIGEAKTPVRPAVTWVDGASDIHNGYEQSVPQMFVPNIFSFATEGKCFRYGSIRMPIEIWGPWHVAAATCHPHPGPLPEGEGPINKRDRNTFWAFGAEEDEQGYMSRYSFQDSIRDKATLPLHFEAVDVKLHIDRDAIDEAYAKITGNLSEQDRDDLAKRAAKMAVLIKAPERVAAICKHIAEHYIEKVDPNGFKAQVVTFDRQCCVLYKAALDELLGPDASAIVISTPGGKSDEFAEWKLGKDEEEKLLDRYRDPTDPLKILVVTSKLLTGFDAPILQAMYLDKPVKDHNLLQAICRTNRPYPDKTHGLIVDYLGIFWLTQVYESVKPPSGNGKLLWHALGAKTIQLVHENVHLETVRDDLDTLVMDAEILESILDDPDKERKAKEVEIKLIARLRKHKGNPKFVELGERLERIKEKHEQGLLHSIDFLKELLTLAREVVEAEKRVDPIDEQAKAKAALTELFSEAKSGDTPVVVERIVTDIDEIVRMVRFPGWQDTHAGEREVQKALRKVIYVKYKVKDQDLFDRAYGYIKQYY